MKTNVSREKIHHGSWHKRAGNARAGNALWRIPLAVYSMREELIAIKFLSQAGVHSNRACRLSGHLNPSI